MGKLLMEDEERIRNTLDTVLRKHKTDGIKVVVHWLQEHTPYVVQRLIDDDKRLEWKNVGQPVLGRAQAFELMARIQKDWGGKINPDHWRVLQKNEADKVLEGYKLGSSQTLRKSA